MALLVVLLILAVMVIVASNMSGRLQLELRHTAASHQLEAGVPLLVVSQNLRHASIQTTRKYLHTEDDARHQASQAHGLGEI